MNYNTGKKEAEKLAKSLLKAVESTKASVLTLNNQFETEYFNPYFSVHSGYSQDEIIGNKYTFFYSNVPQNLNYSNNY